MLPADDTALGYWLLFLLEVTGQGERCWLSFADADVVMAQG